MKISHLTPADQVRQPWKNGGGTTTELARHGGADRWLWRLSVADVDRSGPFSDFTGYRRIIALLDGRGMALSFDRAPPVVLDRRGQPFAFDGGFRTHCRLLDGAIRDLNLIVDAARVDASLDVRALDAPASFRVPGGDCTLLHAIAGRFEITAGAHAFALAPRDLLRVDDAATALSGTALGAHAVLAQITIVYRR